MAQKVTVTLVDDLDGGEATETVEFGIDGMSYQLDLSQQNAQKLRDALADYCGAGRKVRKTGQGTPNRPGPPKSGLSAKERRAVREWVWNSPVAKQKGLKVGARGVISAEVLDEYRAAHA